jgi:outer membrane protein
VPPSPDRPWHFPAERKIEEAAKALVVSRLAVDDAKVYSLAELVDFAERNNPETRVAWEGAKSRGAALHIAQSELYPALAVVALSQVARKDVLFGSYFFRQTVAAFGPAVQLDYTMSDFGARAGRIATTRAELAAANFVFNVPSITRTSCNTTVSLVAADCAVARLARNGAAISMRAVKGFRYILLCLTFKEVHAYNDF